MRSRWSLAIAGLGLILAGGVLAYLTQTSGGIQVRDVRFAGAKGVFVTWYIVAGTATQAAF